MSDDSPKPAPNPARHHLYFLVLSCAVLVATFSLQVLPDGDRVSIREMSGAKIPPLCVTRTYLGIKCPGCGMTRSFIYLAHGDFAASFRAHRLGWLLFGLTVIQIPYRLHATYWPPSGKAMAVFAKWFGRVMVVLLLANWVGDLLLAR